MDKRGVSPTVIGIVIAAIVILFVILFVVFYEVKPVEEEVVSSGVQTIPAEPEVEQAQEPVEELEIPEPESVKEPVTITIDPADFEVEIFSIEDIYKVDRKVDMYYTVKYTGDPIEGVVLKTEWKEGIERKAYSIRKVYFGHEEEFSLEKVPLKAFSIDEERHVGSRPAFVEEGVYAITISLYDCFTIEQGIGKTCDDLTEVDAVKVAELPFIEQFTKSIIVVED